MKKIVYFIISLLLCVGAVGATVAIAKQFTDKTENESSVEESSDNPSSEITLKDGETLLTDPAAFCVNKWYRFYIDRDNPESEACIVLNLVRDDGGFDGGFTEVGSSVEVDMPKVTIGISSAFTDKGYIYWNETTRLTVDAECSGGENYFDIYLEENVYTGMGDNDTIPSIWFELTQETECLEIVSKGGGYVVVLDDEQQGSNETTSNELVVPANESSLIADGLEMVAGASVAMGDTEYNPAIRFSCIVDADLKEEVENDENKSFAFLVAPLDYFDGINSNNYTYVDWVSAFAEAGKTVIYSVVDEDNYYTYGSDYMLRFRLQNVLYTNMNRKFVCMLVLATKDGDTTTYKYNAYPDGLDYRSNARSVAYVAAAALNANTLGLESFTDDQKAILQGYINQSVDLANGLEEATDDGSTFKISTNVTSKKLSVGETFQVVASYSPSNVALPFWYRSNDTSIVTVDDNGLITAVGTGTAVIGVYLAGEVVAITVTVA